MTYRALWPGKVTELNCSTGSYIGKGNLVAQLMWTDKNGKSVTGGTTAPIHAPFSGVMQVFLDQGDQFDEGDPIFKIDPR